MGLFDQLDSSVKISSGKNNDKAGTYWQRIDKIELLTSRKKVEYVKVSKTTIRVIEGETTVGEETSEAFFRDEYSFLEKDLKRMAQVIYNMTVEEASILGNAELKKILIDSDDPQGVIVQAKVTELMKKGGDGTFAKVRWSHSVSPEALADGLSDEAKAEFFPEGVTA